MRLGSTSLKYAVLLVASALAPAALAQVPDQFKNLQVLPRDISRTELVATMRNWTGEVGMRCHQCHEGPEDLKGMDFASDAKPTKRAAREMLRMVLHVNQDTLPRLPAVERVRATVTCDTCHRGLPKPPLRLHEELVKASASGGAAAARARYDELRRDHGEAGRYDFRPASLWMAGRRIAERGRLDDGLALVRLSIERNPAEAPAHSALGFLLLQKGDRAAAVRSFERALELAPGLPEAQWGLRQAGSDTASPSPRP